MANQIKMPTVATVKKLGIKSIVAGGAGGLGVALGSAILGPTLGAPLGAIVAGAAVGGDAGETVAINGVMDGTALMFMGSGNNGNSGVM